MTDATSLQIEEYKYARESIFKAERTMQAVFIFSIITSFSLFSAMLTVVVKGDAEHANNFILPWVFLTPMVIILPLFEMIKGQRDSIIRDACYMIVFFEEDANFKVGFCTRLNKLRENMEQSTSSPETGGPIPNTYFFIWTFSTVLFSYFMKIFHLENGAFIYAIQIDCWKLLYLLVPCLILIVLMRQKTLYVNAMSEKKNQYIDQFRLIKQQEGRFNNNQLYRRIPFYKRR